MSEATTKTLQLARDALANAGLVDHERNWTLYREAQVAIAAALSQSAPSPQPAVPDGGDFFVLDDEAKAMIVNSHHYTPENIQALIEQLAAFADPAKTTQADWDNLDWRGFCNVLQRIMMGLACDLQPAVPVVEAFAEGWRMAADWANRDDLLPDMDSPQYAKERDERLAELRPAVEPMTPEQMRAILTEAGYDDANVQARADFINGARYGERHHGITAKAEGGV